MTPADLKWQDGPPGLPAGGQFAVLEGDPKQPGPFTMRAKVPAGGFAVMPARLHHFAWTTEETTLQVHGIGPWGINYINPADDPRPQQ